MGDMLEQAWCVGGLVVTVLGQAFDEPVLGQLARLWQSIDVLVHFDHDGVIVREAPHVVFGNDILRIVIRLIRIYSGDGNGVPK